MSADQYLNELSEQLAYLFEFSRQMSELDFAGALSGEFRGAQDAGWATTITAQEVHKEIVDLLNSGKPLDKRELRITLMLYCQLSEAGGVYETLKNLMGIVKREPYLLWPFKDLVKVKLAPKRIIGPNANTTFRDLASNAKTLRAT